jgi:hypothetical protein
MSQNQTDERVQVAVIATSGVQAAATSNTSVAELRIVTTSAALVVQVGDPILVNKP